jgi:molecular chaperone GrpE
MDKIVRIPVRVQSSAPDRARVVQDRAASVPAGDQREEPELPVEESPVVVESATPVEPPARVEPPAPAARPSREPEVTGRRAHDEDVEWRNLALRLQAEMDNYRKRQQRLAEEQIESARLELLRGFLPVLDNLERALAAPGGEDSGLREGVQLTYREMLQRLRQQGVERIPALDEPFDPTWHEAVSAVPHDGRGIAPGTVVKVLEPGYRLGGRLLRPARVIVAI